MRTAWIGQPFEGFGGWTSDWLKDVLADPRITSLRIAVAWMKRSGLSRMLPVLQGFRQAGGTSQVIIGIDEGGATREGLEDALALFDEVYVFHDPGKSRPALHRTFHPKVYIASGPQYASVISGSNNLTAGGLYSNYEASLVCDTDFSEDGDRSFFQILHAWFETLLGESELCLRLTPALIAQLLADPKYRIGTEGGVRSRYGEASDSVTDDMQGASIFGEGKAAKKGLPLRRSAPARRQPTTARAPAARRRRRLRARPVLQWSKLLTGSDAQQPPNPNSAETGNLRLTQAGHAIDQKTYFRSVMFGSVVWLPQTIGARVREEAIVPFEVTMVGNALGAVPLKIDHADYRIAGQNNAPTWLHWGTLMPALRATSYAGRRVVISRQTTGVFTLEIV